MNAATSELKESFWARLKSHARFKRKYLAFPYAVFLVLFVILPLLLIAPFPTVPAPRASTPS